MEPFTPLDAAFLTGLLLLYAIVFMRSSTGDGDERYRKERKSNRCLPPPWVFVLIWMVLNFSVPVAFWMYTRTQKVMDNNTQWLFAVLAHAVYFISNYHWNTAFDRWEVVAMRVIVAISLLAMCTLVGCAARSVQNYKITEAIFPLVIFVVTASWLLLAFMFTLQLPADSEPTESYDRMPSAPAAAYDTPSPASGF